jgi:hypothetical protein
VVCREGREQQRYVCGHAARLGVGSGRSACTVPLPRPVGVGVGITPWCECGHMTVDGSPELRDNDNLHALRQQA